MDVGWCLVDRKAGLEHHFAFLPGNIKFEEGNPGGMCEQLRAEQLLGGSVQAQQRPTDGDAFVGREGRDRILVPRLARDIITPRRLAIDVG